MNRTCKACDGTGVDLDGTTCLVCLGSGQVSERIPASDALADYATLLHVADSMADFHDDAYETWWLLREASEHYPHAGFKAVPGLRG